MKNATIPFVLAVAMGLGGFADGAGAMTLEEALVAAYMNNPTLKAQQASLRAVDELVPQALANWRPTVSLTGDYGVQVTNTNTSADTLRRQHREPWNVGVEATQNLYRGGRTLNATRKAEETVLSQRADLHTIEQNVLLDASTAYLNVVRDMAVLELNTSNERVLERQLEATRDRFRVGEITRTDVSQAEARLAKATADRIQAEGNLEVSRANFVNVVGTAPEALTQPAIPADLPTNREEAISTAEKNNPQVISAFHSERAAMHNISLVRGEFAPTVKLKGKATRGMETLSETSRSDVLEAKVELTMPLYEAGATYSRLREAKQSAGQERMLLDQSRRDAIESASSAWDELASTRARLKSIRAQIAAAEVALDGVQREAQVGSRTVLDVLDAEQELLDAKVSHVRGNRDELVAIFSLRAAIGKLTAQDLALSGEYYNPIEHYNEVRDKWVGGRSSGDAGDMDDKAAAAKEGSAK